MRALLAAVVVLVPASAAAAVAAFRHYSPRRRDPVDVLTARAAHHLDQAGKASAQGQVGLAELHERQYERLMALAEARERER